MGDIAQILAPVRAAAPTIASSNSKHGSSSYTDSTKAIEIAGMSKESMSLLKGNQDPSSASLPPVIPTFTNLSTINGSIAGRKPLGNKDGSAGASAKTGEQDQQEFKVKVGNKMISSSKRARPWTWAPFASSSRTDGAMFRHWVRKNVEYTDYPYAKFDVHMDPVTYTNEEYVAHLQSDTWTRSETDRLMELARIFECRWPVVFDRFCFENSSIVNTPNHSDNKKIISVGDNDGCARPAIGVTSTRKIEDLQNRYYRVAATLAQLRIAQEAASEARALSAAAAKSATTSTKSAAPTTVHSAIADTSAATSNSTDRFSPAATQQERTENLLLESAAARSLATSAKQHQPLIAHIGTGTSNKMFEYEKEQERRHHIDRLWRRSKEDEDEELQLKTELKTIDAQLRKLKKHGGHILAAGTTKTTGRGMSNTTSSRTTSTQPNGLLSQLSNTPSSRGPSRSATPVPSNTLSSPAQGNLKVNDNKSSSMDMMKSSDLLDKQFASTAPVPMSQYPYLQSGRLVPPATGGSFGINKSLLAHMNEVLRELNISDRPVPTKRVCDMYDLVRKDVLTLLTLKKILMQREGTLQSKRLRLSRIGGSLLTPEEKVLDEERLLGITPPPKPTSTVTGNLSSAASKSKPTKRRSTGVGGGKPKATAKKGSSDTGTIGGATIKKKTVKRKRKVDPSKSPNVTSTSASSKPPAPGSATAKAAKSRTTSATIVAGTAVPRFTTAPRANIGTQPTSTGGVAVQSSAVPKAASKEATTTKKLITTTTVGEKTGSAVKRSRKS